MPQSATQPQNASGLPRPGERVQDREQLEQPDDWPFLEGVPHVGIVLEVLDVRAGELVVESRERTVAEDNPDYPDDDRVVQVAWSAELDAAATTWRDWSLEAIASLARKDDEVTIYHFPASRLVEVDA